MAPHLHVDGSPSLRLDSYLVAKKLVPTRSQGMKWIRDGFVLVNSRKVKPAYEVRRGDLIDVQPPPSIPSELIPEKIPLDILYEDSDLLVLNKGPSMVVHPGAGHWQGTITHALLGHCGSLSRIGGVIRPGIVHRLDKGTSGAMVVAKNDKSHLHLSAQFSNRQVKKIYEAVVYGRFGQKSGSLEGAITRSPAERKKFAVGRATGKKAVTHYRVIQEGEGLSLVELNLETGRTHQIRVHLTHEGHSIVGDPLYGGNSRRLKGLREVAVREKIASLTHPLLHARLLSFVHPTTEKVVEFEATPPKEFEEVVQLCFGGEYLSNGSWGHRRPDKRF